MSDVTTTSAESSRKAVADRQWIDAAGKEVTDEMKATGFRYVDLATKEAFVYQVVPGSQAAIALAIMGGLTKAGNIRNTAVNGPGADPASNPIELIADWFQELDNGIWSAERAGGPGARFNKDLLAQAIATAAGHKVGSEFHLARLARLEANERVQDPDKKVDADKNLILYGTFALRNKAVKDAYDALIPKKTTAPAVDAL